MSGEKEKIVELVQLTALGHCAAESLANDINTLGTPESWKVRLPQMVASGIPSEVTDLIEALQTTPLALPEETATGLLIQTYKNGADRSLQRAERLEMEGNFSSALQARQDSKKDALQVQAFRTGRKTVEQAIAERREERKQIFPDEPEKQGNQFLQFYVLGQEMKS